jgi:hypothetical protein
MLSFDATRSVSRGRLRADIDLSGIDPRGKVDQPNSAHTRTRSPPWRQMKRLQADFDITSVFMIFRKS